ncbi:hypothetical protein ACFL3V_06260 [Nanoarchaeota archaeon]
MVRTEDYDLNPLNEGEDLCKECLNFKDFKEKCWYFWEKKKECSQKLDI